MASLALCSSLSPPSSSSSLLSSSLIPSPRLFLSRKQPWLGSLQAVPAISIRCEGQIQGLFISASRRWAYEGIQKLGPDIWNKTWYPKAADHDNHKKTWYVVDAADKRLGRLASTIAIYIRGKNLVTYTPSVDMGAFVVVVNAEKVAVTGKKQTQKLYRRHSGRPGGMTEETFDQLQQRIPERIIEHAVRGMLPKGRLGRHLFTHLKVYKGAEHPHAAQKPEPLPITDKRINYIK